MGFKYLNDKSWSDITRDERFFCSELYSEIKKDTKGFVKWLSNKIPNLPVVDKNYEVGFEVCFFRDYIKEIGETDGNKSIKNSQYSQKRTFDLCIFSDNCIIVIEAKAYTGFNTKQLDSFDEDKKYLKALLVDKCPQIFSVGLFASNYKPKQETIKGFDCIINWQEMYDLYNQPIFLRANKTDLVVKED